jgi:hypothetical protein
MNFIEKILHDRISSLETDERLLKEVKEWAESRRDTLDRFGPCITTSEGNYVSVSYFEHLEEILGTS